MTTAYTTLLGLALPVDGELTGTWGQTVNNYITTYLDGAVAGTQIISGSLTAVTLSKTTGSSLSQAEGNPTGSSQYQIIRCTGNPASLLTITVPAADKTYIVINATSTSQSVKIVGVGPTSPGVTITSGSKAIVAWNGSDFVEVSPGTVTSVAATVPSFLSVSGSPITSSGTLAISLSGTALPVANGGTGATTAAAARTNLEATTVGGNVFTLTNPSAITFPRFNADNTVSALNAADFRTAIGAGSGGGTVTSVSGTAPVSVTNGTTTPAISMPAATVSVDGYLTSTDWNTFNNKLSTTGTAASATNIAGGSNGTIPYQSANGTTAMLAAGTSGKFLQSNGASAPSWETFSGGGFSNLVVFTSSGTWSVPAGVTKCKVTVTGGGAGGASSGTSGNGGASGAAGGTAIKFVTLSSGTATITIGAGGGGSAAGGTSSFVYSATTVSGGGGASSGTFVAGAGGTASGGDLNISGGGGTGIQGQGSIVVGGAPGGNSIWGGAGGGGNANSSQGTSNGQSAAANSGSGGGGPGASSSGGSGAAGIVIIEY